MNFLLSIQSYILLSLQTVCWVIALLTAFTRNLSRRRKCAVLFLEISSALLLISEVVFRAYNGVPSVAGWWAVRVSKFTLFLFTFAVLFSFNLYVTSLFTDEKLRPPVLLRVADILIFAGVAILVVSQFTGFSYYFDDSNTYHRALGRTLSYVITFAVLILQMISICLARKHISKKILLPLLLFTLIPFAAAGVQFAVHDIALVNMVIVSMTIVLFIFTIQDMNDRVEKAHKMEIQMHEKYQRELEQTVDERTKELRIANEKAESLLLNILPADIAAELTEHPGRTIAKGYPNATVLFTDIVGFTKMSSTMTAQDVVFMLNQLVSRFDERARQMGVEKIKTIGDAYMAASGLMETGGRKENAADDEKCAPAEGAARLMADGAQAVSTADFERTEAEKMIRFAKGLLEDVAEFNAQHKTNIQIRVGINTGELVAGVIGKSKFIYDIWGDTVNVASRMESTGEPMKIHVSEATHALTKNQFAWSESVEVAVKGKGTMRTWFL